MADRAKLDPIYNLVYRLPPNEIGDAIKKLDVFVDEANSQPAAQQKVIGQLKGQKPTHS